jgi:Taurine catabolism dioxygenase TauD, TfdA family
MLRRTGWAAVEYATDRPLIEFAEQLGSPVATHRRGPLVARLEPTPAELAPKRSQSGRFGLGSFPFHTDAAHFEVPPHYMVLRSVGTSSRRPTYLAPFGSLGLMRRETALLEHEVWLVSGGRGRFLTSILARNQATGRYRCRFDMNCMQPADDSFGKSAQVLLDACKKNRIAWTWEDGVVLIIDNWRTLHARGGDVGHYEERILERVLIT